MSIEKKKIGGRQNTLHLDKKVEVVQEDGSVEVKPLGKRTPVHKQKAVGFKARPGWKARQIVEKPGRLEAFLEGGYVIARDQTRLDTDGRLQDAKGLGDICRSTVNKHNLSRGDAATAVWVEIPEKLWLEDQEDKLKKTKEQEDRINPEKIRESNPDVYYTAKFKQSFDD